jgi:hypothetical protein
MIDKVVVYHFLCDCGIPPTAELLLLDSDYVCPSEKWVREVFAPDFKAFKQSLAWSIQHAVDLEWVEEEFDCDNFSLLATSYASILHHATRSRKKEARTGFLFGEFYYTMGTFPFGGHAINAAIVTNERNRPRLLFFEPQDCTIVQLTQSEIESCYRRTFLKRFSFGAFSAALLAGCAGGPQKKVMVPFHPVEYSDPIFSEEKR